MDKQVKLGGIKNDNGKPKLGLVPKSLIWAVGTILTFGADKYGDHNWRSGLAWSRVYDALLRHLTAWWSGENLDKESGKSHLWHAACELAFLIEYEEAKGGIDDRYKGPTSDTERGVDSMHNTTGDACNCYPCSISLVRLSDAH